MATCEITTFETHLSPSRNALVDDIDVYLHQDCTARYHNTNFGMLKMALDMEVILPLGQNEVMQNEFGNYAEIVESDRIWYYFITACEWTSQNAVKVKLSIDSINTFRGKLEWSPQTTIEREHIDRMFLGNDNRVYRYIDPEPENIPTTKHIESKTKLLQNNQDINWYLIYDSELGDGDTSRPVRCRCIADQALTVYRSGGASPAETWTSSTLTPNQYRYITSGDNNLVILNYTVSVYNSSGVATSQALDISIGDYVGIAGPRETSAPYFITYWTGNITGFRIGQNGANVQIYVSLDNVQQYRAQLITNLTVVGSGGATPDFVTGVGLSTSSVTVKQLTAYRNSSQTNIPIPYANYIISDTDKVVVDIGSSVTRTTIPFSQVDRTDSRLIKIINLPYAPCTVTYDSSTDVYSFPSEWRYENGYMRLVDASLNTEFSTTVRSIDLTDVLVNEFDTNHIRRAIDFRSQWRESKMFSSQFSTYKLVYDSFALEVPLENIYYYDEDSIGIANTTRPITFDITFKPSNTMNSHFAFYADLDGMIENNPALLNGAQYLHHGDYDEYVVTTRNNEESIFSSAYLDYIRNGYNYDKKLKADQATMAYLMGGLQAAGSIVSFAAGAVTGGVSVAAGVALATSAITTFAGAAHNDAVAGEKMNQKLKELALQGVNVSSGDDVDLLKFYAGNKAYWIRYITDAYQYYPLLDLFHYCGYKHPRHEVPNVTSRYWFNFIQCDPVFSNEGQLVWQNYLDDIRARYRAGVTVYHRHPGVLNTAYDWNQTHENWEIGLVQTALYSNWVKNINMDDHLGFVGHYDGPLTLNGSTTYIEAKWEHGSITETSNSIGQAIAPGTNFHFGREGQYQYQGAVISWRIVSTDPHYITSAWGHKTM